MKKHIVSLLLVLVLALSILPMAAFAAPAESGNQANLESLLVHTGFRPDNKGVLLKNPGDSYSTDVVFNPATLEYTLAAQTDSSNQLRFQAKPAHAGDKVILHYGEETKDITWSTGSSQWANCLTAGRNVLKLEVVPAEGSGRVSTTYTLNIDCVPTLTALTATADSSIFWSGKFVYNKTAYGLTLPANLDKLVLNATPRFEGATVTFNGQTSNEVALDGISKIEVKVAVGEVSNIYTLDLIKVPTNNFRLNVASPSGAIVHVYDPEGKVVTPNADGSYTGMFSHTNYTYTITMYGYIAETGTVPADGGELTVSLKKAPDGGHADVNAYWPNFRGNGVNMAITNTLTPIDPNNTFLKWNQKLGEGWGAAPSVQIIVDNSLIVMCGNKTISKMDLQTGKILKQGNMVAPPDWGYTPPAYGDGMIFCPLGNGTIQAFDADTLESLWVYQDPLKGQSLSPITYSNGYIYTGFWNSETRNANFVCLSVTDEDPSKADEAKVATWVHTQPGGFYWAGSVAVGNAIIVGTEDGTNSSNGTASVYAFDKLTGKVISKLELTGAGDQRSSIAYDAESSRIYFTTKEGYLCRANVNPTTGALSELKMVNNVGKGEQCTSTPVIYKGKAYYTAGKGFKDPGRLVVADAESMEALYSVQLKAYPQCSLLLSTAYEASTGYIYLYSTYNAPPGGISMIKIDPTKDTADGAEVIELYDAEGFSQYCITSIICGPDGTLYYKNDSCNVLAVGTKRWTCVENIIDGIGNVTLESEAAIASARNAYNSLSPEDQAKVANYSKLTEAEEMLTQLKDQNTVNSVIEKIDAIGTVDLNSKNAIDAARAAYDALTEDQKKLVTNYETLVEAEKKLAELEENHADEIAANAVIQKIDAIGTVTWESRDAIEAARKAYDALTPAQKELVHNYSVLVEAEAALEGTVPPTGDSTNLSAAFACLTLGLLGCVATVLAFSKKKSI